MCLESHIIRIICPDLLQQFIVGVLRAFSCVFVLQCESWFTDLCAVNVLGDKFKVDMRMIMKRENIVYELYVYLLFKRRIWYN